MDNIASYVSEEIPEFNIGQTTSVMAHHLQSMSMTSPYSLTRWLSLATLDLNIIVIIIEMIACMKEY